MTARRSKPSFASLLRHASWRGKSGGSAADQGFRVDPTRVRLWHGLGEAPSYEECRDRIGYIAREGQAEPVTVRPVFDDEHFEYEVIAGACDWVAVRHLRDVAMPRLELLVRVELVDDDGAGDLAAADDDPLAAGLPEPIVAAFGDEPIPAGIAADLAVRLDGPRAPVILATAIHIARAQDARRGDGLPPYPVAEVMRLLDAVGAEEKAAPIEVSLGIVDADAGSVTFRLTGADELPPETLARVVKAMIDGAAADGIAVTWATAPTAATSP